MNAGRAPLPVLSVIIATHDNRPVLERCLESWFRNASDQLVELIVVEDGCSDGTVEYLRTLTATPQGQRILRAVHEDDVHELMCTNRGFRETRAPLVLSWHDDMFLRASWLVPELVATFAAYPDIGLISLSRGLYCHAWDAPVRTWEDSVDWRRLESTIGAGPLNWVRLQEVDAVVRPWAVRRACIDAVGPLDEAFRPNEWDEADFCYRIRSSGLKIATHGYERDGAYEHLLSTTLDRTPSDRRQAVALRNALLFHERWDPTIAREATRWRQTWPRRMAGAALAATAGAFARRLARRIGRAG